MNDPASIVGEHDEDKEDAKRRGRNREEVKRHEVADMVVQECPLGLRGRFPSSRHPPGDGPLRDVDSELQEFAVHTGCAPQDVGMGIPANPFADLAILRWPTGTVLPGEASPVRGEAFSMPAQNTFGLDDDQSLLPVPPGPAQDRPEGSIPSTNPGPPALPAKNRKLLTECEVLERQIRPESSGGQEKG